MTKRRLIESMSSMSGGAGAVNQGKIIKNLRTISLLDIVCSGFSNESMLLYSQVLSEFFI